ncbi:MAG: serine/threonine-protein kinase PknK [Deltaproteobacteria bacterium]|nr:MAG: serine/threonine-protein kinase PknK [Deltaproteobacteria bacterium]
MTSRDFDFPGTERFEVLSRLGSGGMGVVYEVFDRETQRRVALKTLRVKNAEMLLRFKDEFRSLQSVQHPNLVQLGELFEHRGLWFFTMELVHGVNFVRYVRDGAAGGDAFAAAAALEASELFRARRATMGEIPAAKTTGKLPSALGLGFDVDKLASALAQLAQALMALHRANKVHRDIKPSNVLVTPEGRAVLLDFGFVIDKTTTGHTTDGIVVGTADYMAPEQAAGRPVTPAADWYAVGVVLYRAMTGRLPYTGSRMEILLRKQQVAPPPPGAVLGGIPPELDDLCVRLLAIDPSRRATGRDILATLGVDAKVTVAPRQIDPAMDQPFVGRQRELALLHDAVQQTARGRAVTLYLTGDSGVGKTALLQRFARGVVAGDPRAIVLAGRCHERESVPYKAIDGVIDVLSRVLRREPAEEVAAVLPLDVGLAANIFPVLRRVEAVAKAPGPPHDIADPLEQRRRLFAAVRELFYRIAERRRLVVIIEDLQWVDGDSLALLRDVMKPPDEPPMLLVASARTEASEPAAALASVPQFSVRTDVADIRHVHLGPLPPAEARELAAVLLREADVDPRAGADAIAHEARGHPLFIDELVQHAVSLGGAHIALPDLDAALWSRIEQLGDTARAIVEVVSIAGAPIAQEVAAEAAGVEFGEFTEVVGRLRASKLTRTTGVGRAEEIEPYHGRVRDAVIDRMSDEQRAACHHRLALSLEAVGADAQALAVHWAAAGDLPRAGAYAEEAAGRAAAALAFDRAAQLYRQAIEWQRPEGVVLRRLYTRLGDALAYAGRGADAARAYLDAAEGSSAAAQLELLRRAAEQLLRSGHVADGLDALGRVLDAAGLGSVDSERQGAWSLARQRARLRARSLRFKPRDATQVSLEALTVVDILWTVAMGLVHVDPARGADFQLFHLVEALDAGERFRVCRAFAAEVAYSAGGSERQRRRIDQLLALAAKLADDLDSDRARGLVSLTEGIAAAAAGEWTRALAAAEAADVILRDCTNVWWERGSAQQVAHRALAFLGRLRDLAERVPARLREADERGDRLATASLLSGWSNLVWLAADDPTGARARADEAMRGWSSDRWWLQHIDDLVAQVHIDLYTRDVAAAIDRVDRAGPAIAASRLHRLPAIAPVVAHLRARALLAAGRRREALKAARPLARGGSWERALAALVAAGAAACAGDAAGAVQRLRGAVAACDAAELGLFAAAARWHLGRLVGGDEGAALVAEAEAAFAHQGVRSISRLAALLAPGFGVS